MALHHLRNTARVIIVQNGRILLMERWRPDMHYFSIPGGGVEPGETPEQTVEREILEETGVTVKAGRQVLELRDNGFAHKIYLGEYIDGDPHLPTDAPEAQHGPDNRFRPGWQAVERLPELPLAYWSPLRKLLVDGLRNGFSDEVVIVSAAGSR